MSYPCPNPSPTRTPAPYNTLILTLTLTLTRCIFTPDAPLMPYWNGLLALLVCLSGIPPPHIAYISSASHVHLPYTYIP